MMTTPNPGQLLHVIYDDTCAAISSVKSPKIINYGIKVPSGTIITYLGTNTAFDDECYKFYGQYICIYDNKLIMILGRNTKEITDYEE